MLFSNFPVRTVVSAAGGLLASCIVGAGPGLAADIDTASRITAVTVFPDAAQVTRRAEIDVPAGASSIILRNLPRGLDPNSLRVEASAGGVVVIGSVASRIDPVRRDAVPSSIAEKLRSLGNERRLVQEKLRALDAKKKMIERYSQASPEKLGERSGPMKVEDWDKAWSAVGEGLAKAAEEIQAAQLRLREISQEMNALRQSNRGQASGVRPTRSVTVDVDAASASKLQLVLSYRIGGARWLPVYDARLSTGSKAGKPSLEIVRRASISQRTGEDWTGVVLTVSTVRVQRGTEAPDLLTQVLRFYEPPPPPAPVARAPRSTAMGKQAQDFARGRSGTLSMTPVREVAREQEAEVDAGPYAVRFAIAGRIDLKGDGSARVFRIATANVDPEIVIQAAPALDTTGFLEARFVNKDAAPILPGVVNLHRDGAYAGRGRFELVAPGDKASLGFGADDSVRITRRPVAKSQSGPGWIGNSRSETSDFETTVKNLHGFPVRVRIVDRVPVSEDAEIVIKPLPTNTNAQEDRVDGKRGVMAWTFDLAPKAERKIRLGWQVQWPNGKKIASGQSDK